MIEVLDLYFQGNSLPERGSDQRIPFKEFYNDALNKEVDLRKQAEIFIREWRTAKAQGRELERFSLFNYPWTLNAYKKAELFREMFN